MKRLDTLTSRHALAAAFSVTLAGAASATGFATVDYTPTTEADPGSFDPNTFTAIPGTLATGPFTIGGTLLDDTADAQAGLTVWSGPTTGAGFGSFLTPRRVVMEYDLAAVRSFSTTTGDVLDARFSFVFDDIVAPTNFSDGLLSNFTLEVFTDTADGALNGGLDVSGNNNDYEGGAIASLLFEEAPGTTPAPVALPGIAETFNGTIDGAAVNFIEGFTDDDLLVRGFIGFEVDVTGVVADAIDDESITHLGFRLLSNEPTNGVLQSLDAGGFNPNLVVDVVPEPGSAALIFVGMGLLAARRRRQ